MVLQNVIPPWWHDFQLKAGEIDPCDAGDKRCGNGARRSGNSVSGGSPTTLTLPRKITPPTKPCCVPHTCKKLNGATQKKFTAPHNKSDFLIHKI